MDIKLQIALNILKKKFSEDGEAQIALALLEKKIGEDRPAETTYPIPEEVENHEKAFALFSDGACRGNPGPGAWASLGQNKEGKIIFEVSGFEERTTNNQMEIQAAIEALHELKRVLGKIDGSVYVFSDSKYLVEGMEKWLAAWKSRGWKKADNKIPENLEKWQQLDELKREIPHLYFRWVKGHAGHPQNERCDQLANLLLDQIPSI